MIIIKILLEVLFISFIDISNSIIIFINKSSQLIN